MKFNDTHFRINADNDRCACRGCSGSDWIRNGVATLRHDSRCDFFAKGEITRVEIAAVASEVVATVEATKPSLVAIDWKQVRRDAREGLASHHSDDVILEGVRSGRISMSDAMNRDD